MERSTAEHKRVYAGMMQSIIRVQYNARLMGVEFAPSGQPARHGRPARKRVTFIANRVRKYPDKTSMRAPLSALEIDQGKPIFTTFFSSISVLFCLMLATLRNAVLLRRPFPRMLRHRELPVSANHAAFSRGKLSASQPLDQAINAPSSLQFAQLRDLALASQSGEAAALNQVGQQFRARRNQLGLSRQDAALRIGCTVEQILVLENGYGNLTTANEMLDRLDRSS